MIQKDFYRVVGVMSGTSLDGLDLALCEFRRKGENWDCHIVKGDTITYNQKMKLELGNAQTLSAYDFVELHRRFGRFIGEELSKFISNFNEEIDFVASHGHTVFHEPDNQVTFQIGCGAAIAAHCGIKTISDFRTLDIAMGGHGAPLVPIGDELLFSKYDACVNLGGFANISFRGDGGRIAFDICPVNIVLNEIVQQYFEIDFDKGGEIGRSGTVDKKLLEQLNHLSFYQEKGPKSLAREWVELNILPLLKQSSADKKDILTTCYHHFSQQIGNVLNVHQLHKVLFTGGGTFNDFFMKLVSEYSSAEIIIPAPEIIDFKEALIFAFLGVLRVEERVNCLSSVTGASKNNIGGSIYLA